LLAALEQQRALNTELQAQLVRGQNSYALDKMAIKNVAYEANDLMHHLLDKLVTHDPVYPALVMNPFIKTAETPRVPQVNPEPTIAFSLYDEFQLSLAAGNEALVFGNHGSIAFPAVVF